jgi:hypothetical protein
MSSFICIENRKEQEFKIGTHRLLFPDIAARNNFPCSNDIISCPVDGFYRVSMNMIVNIYHVVDLEIVALDQIGEPINISKIEHFQSFDVNIPLSKGKTFTVSKSFIHHFKKGDIIQFCGKVNYTVPVPDGVLKILPGSNVNIVRL